mmetsp:Transcript_3173/g.9176  ORF Transcript_3173/g.9176 Transcript_3173/m.9176 type:complete len:717 (-) Transcript_3173:2524-4674(-)
MRTLWRALATLPYIHYHATSSSYGRGPAMRASSGGGAATGAAAAGSGSSDPGGSDEAPGRPAAGATVTIGYVTDVEGNRHFWDEYVRISSVLDRDPSAGSVVLRDGCEFVFGGDVVDKGDGDLHVLRDIVQLKRAYPDRVHLIMGNRDVNKIRFAHELERPNREDQPARTGEPVCEAWWSDVTPPCRSEAQRLRWMLHHTMGSQVPCTFELRRSELARDAEEADARARAERAAGVQGTGASDEGKAVVFSLGTLFTSVLGKDAGRSRTGGAPTSGELALAEAGGDLPPVSDEEVVSSFVRSVGPGGLMRTYLELAQIGAVLGDCLFIHGAISEECMRKVPPRHGTVPVRDVSGRGFRDAPGGLLGWIGELNRFAAEEVASWVAHPHGEPSRARAWAEEGGYGGRGGEGLVQYGMGGIPMTLGNAGPGGKRSVKPNPTVIYATWFHHGAPVTPPRPVVDYVAAAGVNTILTGHQPIGDTPVVIPAGSSPAPGAARAGGAGGKESVSTVTVVAADTSYSNNVRWLDPEGGLPADGPAALDPKAVPKRYVTAEGKARPVVTDGGNRGQAVLEVVVQMDARVRFGRAGGSGPGASWGNADAADDGTETALMPMRGSPDDAPVEPTRVSVHGVLSDGRSYQYSLPARPTPDATALQGDDGDPYVGRALEGGWIVRAPLPPARGSAGERTYVLTRGQGYDMFNLEVPEGTLRDWFAAQATKE